MLGPATLCGGGRKSGLVVEGSSSDTPQRPDEQQGHLKMELARSEAERRTSLSKVSRSLSELSTQLENTERSFLPWSEVSNTKQQVTEIQHVIEQQAAEAKQKQDAMESQLSPWPWSETRAVQEGIAKSQQQRRRSLSDVSQSLEEINQKLDNAEASWAPWDQVNDAKQQLADMQNIVAQQLDTGKQERKVESIGHQDKLSGA